MDQGKAHTAQATHRTVANQIVPPFSATASRGQSDSALLESCWQRPWYKRLVSKPLSGVRDQRAGGASMISTLHTSHSMTQRSHGQSGPSIWRLGCGVPLIWMRFGTPLWKADPYPSLFVFPMERSLQRAQSCSAQTQTARTARLSRKAASMSFTGRSSSIATFSARQSLFQNVYQPQARRIAKNVTQASIVWKPFQKQFLVSGAKR